MPVPTTNLVLDVKAGVGETLSGSEITAWADQSGLGNHLTGQTANTSKPISTTDTDGVPVVRFQWGFGGAHPRGYFDVPSSVSGLATRSLTVYAVFKGYIGNDGQCVFSIDGYGAGFARFFSVANNTPFMMIATRESSQYVPINKSLFVWSGRAADSVVQFNNTRTAGITAVGSATGLSGGDVGRFGGGPDSYLSGDLYRLLVYTSPHTNSEIDTVVAALYADHSIVTSYDKLAVLEGDSLTAGVGSTNLQSWPFQLVTPSYDWLTFNLGQGSTKIGTIGTPGTMAAEAATQIDPLYAAFPYSRRVLLNFGGTNDIGSDAQTGAQTFTRLVNWFAAETPVGWKTVAMTIPDRSGLRTPVSNFNTLIRGGDASIKAIVDCGYGAADTRLSDYTNLTYFDSDQLHLTNAGYGVVAEAVRNYLISSITPNVSGSGTARVGSISSP